MEGSLPNLVIIYTELVIFLQTKEDRKIEECEWLFFYACAEAPPPQKKKQKTKKNKNKNKNKQTNKQTKTKQNEKKNTLRPQSNGYNFIQHC